MSRLSNHVAQRTVVELEELLRSGIRSGEHAPGQLLPSARELARRHGIGLRSVRHALRALKDDALISAEPRRGYRVLARAGGRREVGGTGGALAFIVPRYGSSEIRTAYPGLLDELQRVAGAGGSPLLALGGKGVSPERISEQLSGHEVRGVIVNSHDPALIRAVKALQVPVVGVDVWHRELGIDSIIQDGFGGGYLAAEHLIGKGHRRIAYFGLKVPHRLGWLAADRLGGALSAVIQAGADIPEEMRILAERSRQEDARQRLAEMLSRESRPTGLVALWREHTATAVSVAGELGLQVGRDLDIVGWGTGPREPGEVGLPRISWSVAEMAEMAVARLEHRRAAPDMPVTVSKISVQLVLS